jgi:hypothetical protein
LKNRKKMTMSDELKDDLRYWSHINKSLGYITEARLFDEAFAYIEELEQKLALLKCDAGWVAEAAREAAERERHSGWEQMGV